MKDWSFTKAYNDNVIKNYSREKSTDDLNKYIRDSIERNVGDLNGKIKYIC